jgi:hypothetical protein
MADERPRKLAGKGSTLLQLAHFRRHSLALRLRTFQ